VVTRLRAALVPVAIAALTLLAALPVSRVYHGDLLTELLVGAAILPVLLSVALRRLPAYPLAPLSVLALAGYTLLAVRVTAGPAGVHGSLLGLWADAARNAIPRLLTALIPIEPQPDTVLVPVVATWVAALVGTEIAVRARRVLLGYAAPTALYVASLVVVGPNAHPALWSAFAFAAAAALGLAATGRGGTATLPDLSPGARLRLRARLAAGAAGALVVLLGLAVVVGPALADRVGAAPGDPRRYVAPPTLPADDENPLIRLSGWALNPDQPLLHVQVDDPGAAADTVLRLRLAVLSDYNGVNWTVGGSYREAGRLLPPVTVPFASAAPGAGPRVRQKVTVDELTGRLLPALAVPGEVQGVRVAYDQATGTLVEPSGLTPKLTYTVYSQGSAPDVNLLPVADVPAGPQVARYLALGAQAPEQMSQLAESLGKDAGAPYQRAQNIADFLSQHYQLVADAPSGHSLANLTFFLFSPRNLGGQRGTTEQFAASFAVLARMLGLPSRVVVGFQTKPGGSAVTGRDALAWPEVLFTGIGWVPFNPLPQPDTPPRPVESDFQPPPPPSTPPPSQLPTVSVEPGTTGPSHAPSATAVAAGHGVGGPLAAGAGAVLLALLIGVPAGVLVARARLRRRRVRAGTPAQRVTGAWQEVLDGLRLAGVPAGEHLAATEVSAHAARVADPAPPDIPAPREAAESPADDKPKRHRLRLPAPKLDELAHAVNVLTFAEQVITAEQADRVGTQALSYVGELRSRRSWWRRLRWSLDPRPLRWARRRPPAS
jgi:Transglutaminase-like superfamily/TgpA N-terminal domain